jgi:hypothetical protein
LRAACGAGRSRSIDIGVSVMAEASHKDFSNPETIQAWRCIGCGRLEASANCIGICQDRMVDLVSAWDYAEVVAALEHATGRQAALEAFVKRLAHVTPREGGWKDTYLALQRQARALLAPDDGRPA